MAEDETLDNATETSGLDNSDIRTNIYEGGFKSWECSFDLARLLLDRGPRKDLDDLCRVNHVVEVKLTTFLLKKSWTDLDIAWLWDGFADTGTIPLRYYSESAARFHSE